MRIRSTRPHFWRSKRIASVSWDARLVLKGLESYVDDNGVGKDDMELILGDIFQRDVIREPSRTFARVSEALTELSQAGLLWRYTVDGTRLLFIAFWEEVQRIDKAQAGRFPRPDGTMDYKESEIRESPKTVREDSRSVAPGVVEEGSRGVGQKEPPNPPQLETVSREPRTPRPTGSDLVRAKIANLPTNTGAAYQIAQALSAALPVPIETGHLSNVASQIDKCLKDGIQPSAIAAGIKAWALSSSWHPNNIPSFVMKESVKHLPGNGIGKATQKAMGYDDAVQQLLEEIA